MKKMINNPCRVFMVLAFIFTSFTANAQGSWDWDDCVEWFKYEGGDLLATYARPMYAAKGYDFRVTQSSPDIIVEITYQPLTVFGSVTLCRYKVVKRTYHGLPYFYNVEVLRDPLLNDTFSTWNAIQTYGLAFNNLGFMQDLFDGVESFSDLPQRKKAAAALTMEFFNYMSEE